MAIAVGQTTDTLIGPSVVGVASGSYTFVGGNNIVIFIISGNSGATVPTAVTAGGITLTNVDVGGANQNGANAYIWLFYGVGIPVGSQTCTATIVGGGTTVNINVLEYTGVSQTTPLDTNVDGAGNKFKKIQNTANIGTFALTVATTGEWIVSGANGNSTVSGGTNNHLRDAIGGPSMGDSNGSVTAGAYSFGWAVTGSAVGCSYAIGLVPFVAATANGGFFLII